jgi:ATP-dependent 26S proteasome regulatory subunit
MRRRVSRAVFPHHEEIRMSSTHFAHSPGSTRLRGLKPEVALSAAQASLYLELVEAIEVGSLVVLEAGPGFGKSTMVTRLLRELPGARITPRDILSVTANSPHAGMEAPLTRLLEDALESHDLVVVDDFDLPAATFTNAFHVHVGLAQSAIHAVIDRARARNKCLLFTGADFRSEFQPESFGFDLFDGRMLKVTAQPFTAVDFAFFLALELGEEVVKTIPIKRVFDHAPGLNGHQLRQLGALLRLHRRTEEAFVHEMIDTRILMTNTNLGEVADVSFSDLKGFETIVDDLTTYVLNPLKGDARFDAVGLAPKRGVLLFGPPGTGKTSIGRALAHQMQGKFFMIDGTIPTEPAGEFYPRVQAVFNAAKKAAPCVLFIDDADVLFQSDRATGLSRYLLTMLDGLESATSGKVAVIMTAMNPNHMPPALLRSGRVELWIETKPPSEAVRAEIIAADVATLPKQFRDYEFAKIGEVTRGFNAADMRRIVSDVKALYARDIVEGRPAQGADVYFGVAADGVRQNKVLLGLAEAGQLTLGGASNDPGAIAPAVRPGERTERQKKASRLRDEMNQCGGE